MLVKLLQFGHGLGAVENGESWFALDRPYPLQFGHGLGAVENDAWRTTNQRPAKASIRPRTRGRGERLSTFKVVCSIPGFNSATDSGPWRTLPPRKAS